MVDVQNGKHFVGSRLIMSVTSTLTRITRQKRAKFVSVHFTSINAACRIKLGVGDLRNVDNCDRHLTRPGVTIRVTHRFHICFPSNLGNRSRRQPQICWHKFRHCDTG